MNKKTVMSVIGSMFVLSIVGSAQASLVNLGAGSFTPQATAITFSEQSVGTFNPVYNFTGLTDLSISGNFTVSFGGFFVGQNNSGSSPDTLVDTTPTSPLTLDSTSPQTFITTDSAAPDSPVLSGTPRFNGVISVLFSDPVAGVGLTGGFFDAIGGTTINAFDVNGVSLGTIVNSGLGMEFYGLADSQGGNVISGISFYITGNEPAGFGIDNLTFGSAKNIIPGVPEPATMLLFGTGIAGLAAFGRRKVQK